MRFAFADSLSHDAIEKIARDPALLSLDGETRNITYLACGIRGLEDLAVPFRDNPKNFTRLLEEILTPLMGQILRCGGVIDRLTTDGFTAYWNAPLDDAEHAMHACEAADGMLAVLARMNEDLTARYRLGGPDLPPVEIGIGIATGPVIAGGFGGQRRLRYSVNGDAVRLAPLLQALSRNYGPAVIVAEETQQRTARQFAFLEVDYVAQGRSDPPVRLYAMLDSRSARASPKIPRPDDVSRTYFPVPSQTAMGQGQGADRAMLAAFGRLSHALRIVSRAHPLFRIQPAGSGLGRRLSSGAEIRR